MATVQFLQFKQTSDDKVEEAIKSLSGIEGLQGLAIGSSIQDPSILQVTAKWDRVQSHADLTSNPGYRSFLENVQEVFGQPLENFSATVENPRLNLDGPGPATANVVEFVQNWFPVSRLTPQYQKQIEEDFKRFDEIFIKGVESGERGWRAGWSLEEKEHDNIKDEKARCYFVVRGWDSMKQFEQSTQTDAFKEAIPILHGWDAQFKLWHVERKGMKAQ